MTGPVSWNTRAFGATCQFEIAGIEPGAYRITVTTAEGAGMATANVEAGASAHVDIPDGC